MSLFDWVEVGAMGAGAGSGNWFSDWFEKNFPGSFSVTLGDALSSVMPGGQQAHIYGDSIQYTVDWEGIIINGLLGKIPAVKSFMEGGVGGVAAGIVAGTGGYVNFVYGRNTGAVYGPTVNVQRGPTTTMTSKSGLFGGDGWSAQANPFSNAGAISKAQSTRQSSIDDVVEVIVSVLSGIMILTGLITEVLATTVFKQPDTLATLIAKMADIGKGNDSNVQKAGDDQKTQTGFSDAATAADADDPNAKLNALMKMLSWGLTSRFMGVIIAVEKIGQTMRDGVYRLPSVEAQLDAAKGDVAALQLAVPAAQNDLEGRIKKAADDAAKATKDVEDALTQLGVVVAGVKQTAETAADDANRTHLAVAGWSVAADNDIRLVSGGGDVMLEATAAGGRIIANAPRVASIRSGLAKLILLGEGVASDPYALLATGATGTVAVLAGMEEVGSAATFTPTSTTLQLGVTDLGPCIQLSEGSIKLSVGGPAGSSIVLTPGSITLKVAEVVTEITPEGITETVTEATREVTPEGHNLTAAETVMNVGVEGVTIEMPTTEQETEAAAEINITLQNLSVDAVSTMEITLTILE